MLVTWKILFLERLHHGLFTDVSPVRACGGSLGCCAFTKLRVLVVDDFKMEGEELMLLSKDVPMLEELVLGRGGIVGWYWKDLIGDIKMTTKLDRLHMNLISKTFEEDGVLGSILEALSTFPRILHRSSSMVDPFPFAKERWLWIKWFNG